MASPNYSAIMPQIRAVPNLFFYFSDSVRVSCIQSQCSPDRPCYALLVTNRSGQRMILPAQNKDIGRIDRKLLFKTSSDLKFKHLQILPTFENIGSYEKV